MKHLSQELYVDDLVSGGNTSVKHLSQELYVDDLVSGGNTSVKHLSQELYVDDLVGECDHTSVNTSVNIYHKNYMWMT